jgi:hypothetical protein
MRKITLVASMLILVGTAAWAGPGHSHDKADMAKKMEAFKAEMLKCAVCKNMAASWDQLAPVMSMDAVKLNDGLAIVHSVSDPSKLDLFHKSCDAAQKAGNECMTMTDEQAKTQLCEFCQGIRSAMKAGAKMSTGRTNNGDMMIMTSADPAVQAQLATMHEKCAMMEAGMGPQAAQ